MHQCLLISEVVFTICSELVSSQIISENYPGTLAAFAATCHAISGPALDALWRTQSSIVPLLRCMSSDLWEEEMDEFERFLYLRRPIVSTDWCRLQHYASRIKVLGYHFLGCKRMLHVSTEVFRALSHSKPVHIVNMCPNICTLDWNGVVPDVHGNNHNFLYIRLFLGPKTKKLVWSMDGADMACLSILRSLPRDCPRLTGIDFECIDAQPHLSADAVADAVCDWHWLESFRWTDTFSNHGLIHLANLPNLQQIDIYVAELNSGWQAHLLTSHQPAFRSLCKVQIRSEHISSCTSLINLMSPSAPLTSITVHIMQHDEVSVVADFIQVLTAHCSHLVLTTLCIAAAPETSTNQGVIDEDLLRPLLTFPNMQDVEIHPIAHNIGNGILEDIAASWPQLHVLVLGTLAGPSQITLSGIRPLSSLSNLEKLSIVINAPDIDYTLMPLGSVSNSKLSHLSLGDARIENPYPVAAFLSDIFPKVRTISSWSTHDTLVSQRDAKKYQDRWNIVAGLVETFAKVRQQERTNMQERVPREG